MLRKKIAIDLGTPYKTQFEPEYSVLVLSKFVYTGQAKAKN